VSKLRVQLIVELQVQRCISLVHDLICHIKCWPGWHCRFCLGYE
jgi:hypothetical protein